jgi:hypothetical protein
MRSIAILCGLETDRSSRRTEINNLNQLCTKLYWTRIGGTGIGTSERWQVLVAGGHLAETAYHAGAH